MALYTEVSLDEARALFEGTGVEPVAIEGLVAGSVNSNFRVQAADGGCFFLRVFEEQGAEGAHAELTLLRRLHARAVPVSLPLFDPPRSHRGKPAQAFPWVRGDHRCQRGVQPADVEAVGRALAAVHLAGSDAVRPSRFDPEGLRARLDAIAGADDPALASLASPLGRKLDEILAARSGSAPRGLVHGDLFRDNVLFEGDRLVALLDFESAADGVLAFDLAVTWLAWCFGDSFDAGLSRALVRGYEAVRPLTGDDRVALYEEARLAALRFTITRITDYAMRAHLGASEVRDHRRFLARLAWLEEGGPDGLAAILFAPAVEG